MKIAKISCFIQHTQFFTFFFHGQLEKKEEKKAKQKQFNINFLQK